jgi:integrase/recombinase XerD
MKYSFNKEIREQLKSFKDYLQQLGYGENSILQKLNYTGCFLEWLENERLIPEATRYNDLLNFIDYCRLENDSNKLINNKLRSIRNYYEYLKGQDPSITNPATNLYLKGTRHKIPSDILDIKDLDDLYNSQKNRTLREKRNKVILGLLIYQGITTEELHQLEPGYLKLKQGKIYIPGNRKRNSRNLELKPFQILELQDYINEIRPKIIKEITTPKPARKPNKINQENINNQLFISINGSENLKNSLLHLFKEIQKTKPAIQNAKQIRTSVIVNWLKTNNLRQVQYMAGHKYVSSTERYQLDNLDKLQDKLEKYHPLNTNNL